MATRRYSYTPNAAPYGVIESVGAATATGPIEITIDLGNVMQGSTTALKRQDVLDALTKMTEYIEHGNWPPA